VLDPAVGRVALAQGLGGAGAFSAVEAVQDGACAGGALVQRQQERIGHPGTSPVGTAFDKRPRTTDIRSWEDGLDA
jgi:hypothetical protein